MPDSCIHKKVLETLSIDGFGIRNACLGGPFESDADLWNFARFAAAVQTGSKGRQNAVLMFVLLQKIWI